MNLVGAKVGGGCCQATGVDLFYFLYGCQQVLLCTSDRILSPHSFPAPGNCGSSL